MARSSLHRAPPGTLKRGLDENDERNLNIFLAWKGGKPVKKAGEENGLTVGAAWHVCRIVEENFENRFYTVCDYGITELDGKRRFKVTIGVIGKDRIFKYYNFMYPCNLKTTKTLEKWVEEEYRNASS